MINVYRWEFIFQKTKIGFENEKKNVLKMLIKKMFSKKCVQNLQISVLCVDPFWLDKNKLLFFKLYLQLFMRYCLKSKTLKDRI
jgi:flagellar assembly factor FliW